MADEGEKKKKTEARYLRVVWKGKKKMKNSGRRLRGE